MFWFFAALSACSDTHFWALPDDAGDSGLTTPDDGDAPADAPIANAGRDQAVTPLVDVRLDGTGSRDPSGGRIVGAEWTLVERPSGSTAELDDDTAIDPMFFADLAGDYVFELTVQNDAGVWDPSPDRVVVNAKPLDGFYVELSWNTATDLDLHLAQDGGRLFGPDDCNYCNMTPDFGSSARSDDASLDADAIDGWGPETITIDDPAQGDYTIRVHFYGENGSPTCPGGCPDTTATVKVYLGGVQVDSFTQKMAGQGSLWEVARIEWPTGQVHELDGLSRTTDTSCF